MYMYMKNIESREDNKNQYSARHRCVQFIPSLPASLYLCILTHRSVMNNRDAEDIDVQSLHHLFQCSTLYVYTNT